MAEHEKGLFCFPSLVASRPPVAAARRNVVLTAAALVCGALACTGGSLQASMESFSFSYGPVTVPESSAMVGTLSKFDSTLGTLTEVQLQLVSTTSAGINQFQNLANVPSDVTLGIGATVTVTAMPTGLATTAVPMQTAGGTVTAYTGGLGYGGTDAFTVSGGSGTDTGTHDMFTGLSPYVGSGSFGVDSTSSVQTSLITDGGFGPENPVYGVTSGTVTVTYFFTATPEPSSIVLLGLGTTGLFWVARRRKS